MDKGSQVADVVDAPEELDLGGRLEEVVRVVEADVQRGFVLDANVPGQTGTYSGL